MIADLTLTAGNNPRVTLILWREVIGTLIFDGEDPTLGLPANEAASDLPGTTT